MSRESVNLRTARRACLAAAAALCVAGGAVAIADETEHRTTRLELGVQAGNATAMPGAGHLIVTDSRQGCPPKCSLLVDIGTHLRLQAVPSRGYAFDHWSDATLCASRQPASPTCELTVRREPIRLTAHFRPTTFTLQVIPSGSARITSGGNGIDCGGGTEISARDVCAAEFIAGARVNLEVEPAPDTSFVRWGTSRCPPQKLTCTAVLDGDRTVTALMNPLRLNVRRLGSEGRITSSPPGIDCAAPCATQTAMYARNARITLRAEGGPSTGFRRWGPPCAGPAPSCTFTLRDDQVVDAAFGDFAPPSFGLTLAGRPLDANIEKHFRLRPRGPGRLSATGPAGEPNFLRCKRRCEDWLPRDEEIWVRAIPKQGARLVRWTCSPRKRPCKIPLSVFDDVFAHFR
jgi:hypothetical protein